jgi:hypothetical protein
MLPRTLAGLMLSALLCSLAQVALARDHGPCFASARKQRHMCSRSGQ